MFILLCGEFGEVAGPSTGPREEILAPFLTVLDQGILKILVRKGGQDSLRLSGAQLLFG
jgi:hypothetical protein